VRPAVGKMGRKKDKHSNSDETALFRESIGEVKPVANRKRRLDPPPPKPQARFSRADDRAVLSESMQSGPDPADMETGEELRFHRPNVNRKIMRQLRGGKYAVQEEIDLHGMTADEAHAELHDFIKAASAAGAKCVRVVHGKGRGSGPKGPVLKAGVNRWLPHWEEVAAFCSAQPRDGGTGAVYVLLKR
jgi:DNA-nicking Smr family endonuclease